MRDNLGQPLSKQLYKTHWLHQDWLALYPSVLRKVSELFLFFLFLFYVCFFHLFYSFPYLTLSSLFCLSMFVVVINFVSFLTISCCKVHDFCENELQDSDKCGGNLDNMNRNFKYDENTYRCCKFIDILCTILLLETVESISRYRWCQQQQRSKQYKMGKITIVSIQSAVHFWNRMINGYVEPYVDFYKETDRYSLRHNDILTLKKRYTRTSVLKYIYFHIVGGNKCNFF